MSIRYTLRRLFIVAAVAFAMLGQGREAVAQSDCIGMVRSLYKSLGAPAQNGAAYYMAYTVRAVAMVDNRRQETVSRSELKVSGMTMHFVSKEAEVYQDGTTAYTLIPGRKLLYMASADMKGMKERRLSAIGALQDSIFTMCSVAECRDLPGNQKRVVLEVGPRGEKRFQIRRIEMTLDPASQMLRKLIITYAPGAKLESFELAVDKMDPEYRGAELARPISSLVYDASNRLLPRFQGYRIIDSRGKRFNQK